MATLLDESDDHLDHLKILELRASSGRSLGRLDNKEEGREDAPGAADMTISNSTDHSKQEEGVVVDDVDVESLKKIPKEYGSYQTKSNGITASATSRGNNGNDDGGERLYRSDSFLVKKSHHTTNEKRQAAVGPSHTNTDTSSNTYRTTTQLEEEGEMIPGAYALGGPQDDDNDLSEVPSVSDIPEELLLASSLYSHDDDDDDDDDDDFLAVANLAVDPVLPQAQEVNNNILGVSSSSCTTTIRREAELTNTKLKKIVVAVACILPTIAMIVILSVVLSVVPEADTFGGQTPPSKPMAPYGDSNLSEAATGFSSSVEGHILSLLPEETVRAINNNQESAAGGLSYQSQAYDWLLNDPNLQNYTNERILQRFALASLYVATNGDKWTRNTNWLSYNVHECEWYISPSFAMTETLRFIYPGYMGGLDPPKRNCYQDDDEEEGSPNSITGIYQNLWLDQNELEGSLPKELYLLTTLKSLSIMYNKLEGGGSIPSQVGQLTNLEGLVLHGLLNMGSVATEIGLLTNLRGLMLNRISGTVPSEIESLTNLETISLHRNPKLSGNSLPFFTHYPNLTWLVTEGSNFTGTIPTVVGKLSALQMWAMNGNRVEGTLPSQVGLLSNLEMLFMPANRMTGTLPTELGRLTSANMLGFRDNLFTGTIPSELGLTTNLKSLMLEGNRFSGTIPTEIGELTSLHRMSFKNNELTGPIPSQLGSLTSLGVLSLGNNSLMTGTIPDELASVMNPKLATFDVGGNQLLSGTIPEGLCRINGSCTSSPVMNCLHQNGLFFDCQNQLCGCDCPCGSIGNQSVALP